MAKSMILAINYGEYSEFRKGEYKKFSKVENGKIIWETKKGSPLSNGEFQFDLWNQEFDMLDQMGDLDKNVIKRENYQPLDPSTWGQKSIIVNKDITIEPTWESLRTNIMKYGVRNSLIFALMPTATTAQIIGNCESTECHVTNLYSREVNSGSFTICNRHLVRDLEKLGVWDSKLVEFIAACNGNIEHLIKFVKDFFPHLLDGKELKSDLLTRLKYLQNKYKTMFQIKQKFVLELASERGPFICQSQSTNIYLSDPTIKQMEAVHSLTHKLRLKTGMYYLRQSAAKEIGKFNLSSEIIEYYEKNIGTYSTPAPGKYEETKLPKPIDNKFVCNEEVCTACQ